MPALTREALAGRAAGARGGRRRTAGARRRRRPPSGLALRRAAASPCCSSAPARAADYAAAAALAAPARRRRCRPLFLNALRRAPSLIAAGRAPGCRGSPRRAWPSPSPSPLVLVPRLGARGRRRSGSSLRRVAARWPLGGRGVPQRRRSRCRSLRPLGVGARRLRADGAGGERGARAASPSRCAVGALTWAATLAAALEAPCPALVGRPGPRRLAVSPRARGGEAPAGRPLPAARRGLGRCRSACSRSARGSRASTS